MIQQFEERLPKLDYGDVQRLHTDAVQSNVAKESEIRGNRVKKDKERQIKDEI